MCETVAHSLKRWPCCVKIEISSVYPEMVPQKDKDKEIETEIKRQRQKDKAKKAKTKRQKQ